MFWPESGLVSGEFLGTEHRCPVSKPGASKGLPSSQSMFRGHQGVVTRLGRGQSGCCCSRLQGLFLGSGGRPDAMGGPAKSACWHRHGVFPKEASGSGGESES